MTLELHAQWVALSWLTPESLAALAYLATIAVFTLISLGKVVEAQASACVV